MTRTNEGKKTNSRKTPECDSTKMKVEPPEQRTGKTASEGASRKKNPIQTGSEQIQCTTLDACTMGVFAA